MSRSVRQYLSARGTTSPALDPTGDRLAFLTETTGTAQVWTIDEPGAWPEQRTVYDERVSFVEWSPDGEALAFGKDEGANEHDQLFRLDPDGGTVTPLTDRPDAIHNWGGFSPDGEQIAFTANRRDPADFDLHVMDATGGEPRIVRKGDTRLDIGGWSPDGDRLVVGEAHSSPDYDLYVVDIDSGDQRHVTPHDGPVKYLDVAWGPDGESLYCASDANADNLELVRIDIDTLDVETVVSGDGWDIDHVALHQSRSLAYTRNVDGYAELSAGTLDGSTNAETTVVELGTDAGVVHELGADPSGERFVVSFSSSTLNPSIFVIDGESGVADRWTTPSTGGVPLDAYDNPELVRYETFDDREIPGYLTLPEGDGPHPVIVNIHGGPHHQQRPWFAPVRQLFVDRGYAYFEPNVRGSSGYGREYAALDDVELRMDSVRDIAEAVEWLHDHPSIDGDRVVSYGRSYGGFMVLATITEYPDLWAAAVDFVGIANWVTFLENTGEWRRSHREAEYGSLDDDREFLESISPIHKVEEIACPLFVQHGENDPRVPVGEARQIAAAVEEEGVPVETCIFDDEGHHTTKFDNRVEQFERISAFLDEHV